MANIYYDPEKFGLKIVCEIEYSSGSYEFDKRVIFMRVCDGKLFTARDSGCSCPTPFEDIFLNDLEDYNFGTIRNEALEKSKNGYYDGDNVNDFITRLPKEAIR